jgi:antitoxin (DNA-binding transcriptional repressor) of toxin-antitoxin stability system
MRSVGIKLLKNKLSEYVRIAAGGEVVLITDRDRVVAELTPPQPDRSLLLQDAFLAESVRSGLITPAREGPGAPPPRHPIMPFKRIMEELEDDREDR